MRQFLNDKLDQFEEKLNIGLEGVGKGIENEQQAWLRSKECKDMLRQRGIRLNKIKHLGYWDVINLLDKASLKAGAVRHIKKVDMSDQKYKHL